MSGSQTICDNWIDPYLIRWHDEVELIKEVFTHRTTKHRRREFRSTYRRLVRICCNEGVNMDTIKDIVNKCNDDLENKSSSDDNGQS